MLSAVGLVLLAACNGAEDGSPVDRSGVPSDTTVTSGSTDSAATPGEPILVGFANLEGGPAFSLPDVRRGFEAAVLYINEQLGGIDGHPIEIVSCNTELTPESSVNCANQFVERGAVMHVGGIDFMVDAALPVLQEAGLLHVSAYAYGPATNTAVGDAVVGYYANEEAMPASLLMQTTLGAESVAFALPDLPPLRATFDEIVVPAAERLGVDVSATYSPPQGADWGTIAATVLASNPDAVSLFAAEPECSPAVSALRGAGFDGVIQSGLCVDILTELDETMLDNVVVASSFYTPWMTEVPDAAQVDIGIFQDYMGEVGGGEYNELFATQGFFTGMLAYEILRDVEGNYTAESVRAAAANASGPLFFRGGDEFHCAEPTWPGTTACGTGLYFGEPTGNGQVTLFENQPLDLTAVGFG